MSHEEEYEKHHEVEVEFPAEFGDLVEIDGYESRVYQVESYRVETNFYPNEQTTDVVYDLVDVVHGDYLEADASDITLLADAGQADEYMRTIDYANYPQQSDFSAYMLDITKLTGGNDMFAKKPQEPRKPTARELSAQEADRRKQVRKERAEQIDNLLDRRNWYAEQLAKSGNEEYGDKLMQVDAELKMLAEADV
ncbi:MAG: hypothetical protein ACQEV7_16395 [Bacillota bacterium]